MGREAVPYSYYCWSMQIKKRIAICLQGSQDIHRIAWYGPADPEAIEGTIKKVGLVALFQVCRLSEQTRITLKDRDGDVVALSDSLPETETFVVVSARHVIGLHDGPRRWARL